MREVLSTQEELAVCIFALRIIALSYRQRIDRGDTEPWEFADEVLKYIGEDIDGASRIQDIVDGMRPRLREWRTKERQ